jgi:hypothetical protein
MNQAMPCITDSDEFRFEPDEPEEESPLTNIEKRIEWICDDWATALECDTYEEWSDVRLMFSGAIQALIYCRDRHEDLKALSELRDMAYENSLDCIRRDRYEGAAA